MTFVLDLVFYQLNDTGIARFWNEVLTQWTISGFASKVTCLVRDDFVRTPLLPNVNYVKAPKLDYKADPAIDCNMLQNVCDDLQASMFISSYYTIPVSTPSYFIAYDCIPEQLGHDLSTPMWQAKAAAIRHASKYIAISHSTAHDLRSIYGVNIDKVYVSHCGVDRDVFSRRVGGKRDKYFVLAGAGLGYKNGQLLLDALSLSGLSSQGYYVVCTGGKAVDFVNKAKLSHPQVSCVPASLTDLELANLYKSASALVYVSKYEGFGLPIVEAMSCGCPVVACRNSSLPEVAGGAAWYVDPDDAHELSTTLTKLAKGLGVSVMVDQGYTQASKFSWQKTASTIAEVLSS